MGSLNCYDGTMNEEPIPIILTRAQWRLVYAAVAGLKDIALPDYLPELAEIQQIIKPVLYQGVGLLGMAGL
jgi:hypothetical protein